jgi:hypothetical protein
VAAALQKELGIQARLRVGKIAEFTVWVGEKKVAGKSWLFKPAPEQVAAAVRAAL